MLNPSTFAMRLILGKGEPALRDSINTVKVLVAKVKKIVRFILLGEF